MNSEDYFRKALLTDAVFKRHWVMSVFSVILQDNNETIENYPYRIHRNSLGVFFTDPERDNKLTPIDDVADNEPVCKFRSPISIKKGFIENALEDIDTTYGCLLINHLCLSIPFGDIIPFQNGYISTKHIENQILKNRVDGPDDPDDPSIPFRAPKGIYVRQYIKFVEYYQNLSDCCNIAVHSVTPKSLLSHPLAQQVKEELMELYKDQLDDPAIVAKIGDEMEKLDRQWLADDPSGDFYIKGKHYSVVRKKLHYMFGAESPFEDGTKVKFLPRPLKDGIDVKELPILINGIREGSFFRGAMTEMGGAVTKEAARALATVKVIMDDCGTKVGRLELLTKANLSKWIGCYYLDENKRSVLLTDENAPGLVGQVLEMRTPGYCLGDHKTVGLCEHCVGPHNLVLKNGLAAAGTTGLSKLMLFFMSAMHGTKLTTRRYDKKLCLR